MIVDFRLSIVDCGLSIVELTRTTELGKDDGRGDGDVEALGRGFAGRIRRDKQGMRDQASHSGRNAVTLVAHDDNRPLR